METGIRYMLEEIFKLNVNIRYTNWKTIHFYLFKNNTNTRNLHKKLEKLITKGVPKHLSQYNYKFLVLYVGIKLALKISSVNF